MRALVLILAVASLSACGFVGFPGVYRIDVEQGNIVTQEKADQLKPGMSRRQVRFLLGTPLVEDSFNRDRWDYLYMKRNGLEIIDEARLTVVFVEDSLQEVRGDYQPAAWTEPAPEEEDPGNRITAADAAAMEALEALEKEQVGSEVIVTPVPELAPAEEPVTDTLEYLDQQAPSPPAGD